MGRTTPCWPLGCCDAVQTQSPAARPLAGAKPGGGLAPCGTNPCWLSGRQLWPLWPYSTGRRTSWLWAALPCKPRPVLPSTLRCQASGEAVLYPPGSAEDFRRLPSDVPSPYIVGVQDFLVDPPLPDTVSGRPNFCQSPHGRKCHPNFCWGDPTFVGSLFCRRGLRHFQGLGGVRTTALVIFSDQGVAHTAPFSLPVAGGPLAWPQPDTGQKAPQQHRVCPCPRDTQSRLHFTVCGVGDGPTPLPCCFSHERHASLGCWLELQ